MTTFTAKHAMLERLCERGQHSGNPQEPVYLEVGALLRFVRYAHSAPQRPTTATPESTLTNPIFCLDAPDHLKPSRPTIAPCDNAATRTCFSLFFSAESGCC